MDRNKICYFWKNDWIGMLKFTLPTEHDYYKNLINKST